MTNVTDGLQRSLSEYNIEHTILPENQMATQEQIRTRSGFCGFNSEKDLLSQLTEKIKT